MKNQLLTDTLTIPRKKMNQLYGQNGYALMEIILMIIIIGIIGANTIMFLKNSWKSSGSSNTTLIAGQMIERQIEAIRMKIAENPENNFPPRDSVFTENNITLRWRILSVSNMGRPVVTSNNVRQCDLTASWGKSSRDTLNVTTFISRDF